MAVTDRIDAMAAPLCDRIGVELLDVEYEGGVLRLVVDHPEGVGMDAIAGNSVSSPSTTSIRLVVLGLWSKYCVLADSPV